MWATIPAILRPLLRAARRARPRREGYPADIVDAVVGIEGIEKSFT